jgi:hypothetical protein
MGPQILLRPNQRLPGGPAFSAGCPGRESPRNEKKIRALFFDPDNRLELDQGKQHDPDHGGPQGDKHVKKGHNFLLGDSILRLASLI